PLVPLPLQEGCSDAALFGPAGSGCCALCLVEMSASVMFITVRLARPDHLRAAEIEAGFTGIAVREDAMLRRWESVERDWLRMPCVRLSHTKPLGFADRRVLRDAHHARDLAVGFALVSEPGECGDRFGGPEIGSPALRAQSKTL